ncbi:MAG: UTP--glucose-1-phosphate uridylyltransferase GalU [Gammaproteobacteria bacterium]|nr:UTP--glucose-1-phosphate uridylyltransferase GalU [Gammaproteobacteria bacterium]
MGTRFLPATKANPKEMLPIVDKPLIQYAAEEAIAAGVKQLIFVTSSSKRAIEDHFDKNYELESELQRRDKADLLSVVRGILPQGVSCVYIRQAEPLGLGHAVLCARDVVGKEAFAVMLADDLIDGYGNGCMAQMVSQYNKYRCSILGVETVLPEETDQYGIVKTEDNSQSISNLEAIIEKPKPADAPSNLGVVGRYILTPTIFDLLENTGKGAGGEIQLTDAIAKLLVIEHVKAFKFSGKRYDCGSKLGYLQATVEYALKHPMLKDDFLKYLRSYCIPNLSG